MKILLHKLISFYRFVPQIFFRGIFFPMEGSCRFVPTCSEYASEAIEVHGVLKGSILALKRIVKCHPLGSSGHDPVPLKARQSIKKRL